MFKLLSILIVTRV